MEKTVLEKVLVIGSYGAGNLGDEGMKEIIERKWSDKFDCTFLTGKPEKANEAPHLPFGIRSFLRFDWFRSFAQLARADAVVFGGGGLWAEHETLKAILLWSWHVLWVRLFKKPYFIFAHSVGPLKSKWGRELTEWSLSGAQEILVRDPLSKKTCEDLGLKCRSGVDLCFACKPPHHEAQKKLALNLRHWACDTEAISQGLDALKKEGYEIVLLATDASDLDALSEFGQACHPKSFQALLDILSECELAVGMRLHFLIAACLAGCKVAGLSYSEKVQGVLDELEVPHQNPAEITEDSFEKLLKSASEAKHIKTHHLEALAMLEGFEL